MFSVNLDTETRVSGRVRTGKYAAVVGNCSKTLRKLRRARRVSGARNYSTEGEREMGSVVRGKQEVT